MEGKVFVSESRRFICDDDNIVQCFEPYAENIIGEKHYRHFIIPEEIVGF